jgi:hypothetical protein
MTPAQVEECTAVDALLKFAERTRGRPEGAAAAPSWSDDEDAAEGLRLAEDHGVSAARISAYRSLARSRGLTLEQVLRAAFRGELRDVVQLPEVRHGASR